MRKATRKRIAAEKAEAQELLEVFIEIQTWRNDHVGASYYDLEEYAYRNDKELWIKALRNKNKRAVFSEYFRSKRRTDHVKYNRDHATSMKAALDAKIDYQIRHNSEPYLLQPIKIVLESCCN